MHMGLGQPYAAVADLERALEVAPTLPQVGQALFFATLATGDLAKAAETLAKIRAAEGDTVAVQYLDAILKLTQLDLGGARQMLTMISRYNPEFLPARVTLAHLLAMLGHGAEGDKILADILAQLPTAEPELGMLAADYTRTGRMADAIAAAGARTRGRSEPTWTWWSSSATSISPPARPRWRSTCWARSTMSAR